MSVIFFACRNTHLPTWYLCRGLNTFGQIGDQTGVQRPYSQSYVLFPWLSPSTTPSVTSSPSPTPSSTGSASLTPSVSPSPQWAGVSITQVVSGALHNCALTHQGSVLCWGQNTYGQLGELETWNGACCLLWCAGECYQALPCVGDGTSISRAIPVSVRNLGTSLATGISTGTSHTCAVVANGQVMCWGKNDVGQVRRSASALDRACHFLFKLCFMVLGFVMRRRAVSLGITRQHQGRFLVQFSISTT